MDSNFQKENRGSIAVESWSKIEDVFNLETDQQQPIKLRRSNLKIFSPKGVFKNPDILGDNSKSKSFSSPSKRHELEVKKQLSKNQSKLKRKVTFVDVYNTTKSMDIESNESFDQTQKQNIFEEETKKKAANKKKVSFAQSKGINSKIVDMVKQKQRRKSTLRISKIENRKVMDIVRDIMLQKIKKEEIKLNRTQETKQYKKLKNKKQKFTQGDLGELMDNLDFEANMEEDNMAEPMKYYKARHLRKSVCGSMGPLDDSLKKMLDIKSDSCLERMRQKIEIPDKFIISVKDTRKQNWDLFILILAVWNSIFAPVELSFVDIQVFNSGLYILWDCLIDLIFLVDIVLMFSTSYINRVGKEEKNPRLIANQYAKSTRFYLDTGSMFGSYFFSLINPNLKLFGLLKITRVFRIGSQIKRANIDMTLKAWLNLSKLVFYLFLFLHILTCFWHSVIMQHLDDDKLRWYAPTFWLNYKDYDVDIQSNYSFLFYHALLFLFLNEIGPVSPEQQIFSIFTLILCILFTNNLFADIALQQYQLMENAVQDQRHIDDMNSIMENIEMSAENIGDINDYFALNREKKRNQEDFYDLMVQLSPTYQMKLNIFLFKRSLRKNPIIQKIDDGNINELDKKDDQGFIPSLKRISKAFEQGNLKIRKSFTDMRKPQIADIKQQKAQIIPRKRMLSQFDESYFRTWNEKSSFSQMKQEFLEILVSKLTVVLSAPEEYLIKQGQREERSMFYVIKGDCVMIAKDHLTQQEIKTLKDQDKQIQYDLSKSIHFKRQDSSYRAKREKSYKLSTPGWDCDDIKLLSEGEFFGEIRCVYNCPRTADIISRTYNTLAELDYQNYKEIVSEYPEFKKYLKQHIVKYDETDRKQLFLIKSLQRVPYFNLCSQECIHDLLFKMIPNFYEKEDTIIREGQNADRLVQIEHGKVEVFVEFEGNKFVIERLGSGAVFNHRTIFMNNYSHVTYQCTENTSTLELNEEILENVCEKQPNFSRQYRLYMNRFYRQNKTYPLDYLHPHITKCDSRQLEREKILKNVVFRIILDIRNEKNKPKLSDIVRKYGSKYVKEVRHGQIFSLEEKYSIMDKLKLMYGMRPLLDLKETKKDEDKKFDLLIRQIDRIAKVLRAIDFQLQIIDQNLSKLEKRKNERIIGGNLYLKQLKKLKRARDIRKKHRDRVAARKEALVGKEQAKLLLQGDSSKPMSPSVKQLVKESTDIHNKNFGTLDKLTGKIRQEDRYEAFWNLKNKKRFKKQQQNSRRNEQVSSFGRKLKYQISLLKDSDLNLPKKFDREELTLGDESYSPESALPKLAKKGKILNKKKYKTVIVGNNEENQLDIIKEDTSSFFTDKSSPSLEVLQYEADNIDTIRNEMDKIERMYTKSERSYENELSNQNELRESDEQRLSYDIQNLDDQEDNENEDNQNDGVGFIHQSSGRPTGYNYQQIIHDIGQTQQQIKHLQTLRSTECTLSMPQSQEQPQNYKLNSSIQKAFKTKDIVPNYKTEELENVYKKINSLNKTPIFEEKIADPRPELQKIMDDMADVQTYLDRKKKEMNIIPFKYSRHPSQTEQQFLNLEYEKPIRDAVYLVWKYYDLDGNRLLDQNEASSFVKETLRYIEPSICSNYDQQIFSQGFIDRVNANDRGGIGKVEMTQFIREQFSTENQNN